MFAQPAALLFFVTKELADGEPLERFLKCALVRGDDARQGWCQLWPHRHFAIAFVGEIEKLIDNFRAAFLAVEIGRLEHWAVPFDETVAARDLTPVRKAVIPGSAVVGQEMTITAKRLHTSQRPIVRQVAKQDGSRIEGRSEKNRLSTTTSIWL